MIDEFHGGSVSQDAGEDNKLRSQEDEQQEAESAFEAAMQLVAAGQSIEQILGSGDFANMPEHIKQQLRGRLQQVAVEREMQQHEMAQKTREQAQEKGAIAKLFTLGMMGSIISKATMEKIQALFAQQPHLQQQIQLQGQNLLKAGAAPDIEFSKSTVQIVTPAINTPAQQQAQTQER